MNDKISFDPYEFEELPGLDEYLAASADGFRDPSYFGIYFDDLEEDFEDFEEESLFDFSDDYDECSAPINYAAQPDQLLVL